MRRDTSILDVVAARAVDKQREPQVKKAIKKVLARFRIRYWMLSSNGYGESGLTDFLCLGSGYWVAIEAKGIQGQKVLRDGKLQGNQIEFRNEVLDNGGDHLVIDHKNIHEFPLQLMSLGYLPGGGFRR